MSEMLDAFADWADRDRDAGMVNAAKRPAAHARQQSKNF